MSKYLIIDTATKNSTISLLFDEHTVSTKNLTEKSQTKQIIPFIKELLTDHGLKLDDLTGIAICTGPGLFTGTRVGVMTAKTLSYATNLPLYPFSTFDLFEEKEPYAALDAKCNRAYLYHNGETKLIQTTDLEAVNESVYTLEPLSSKYILTKKNIKGLYGKLLKTTPVDFEAISIIYPK